MQQVTQAGRLSKVTLGVGYAALLVGVVAAFRTPATGYELSVYAATPAAFWVGVALAVATSLTVAFTMSDDGLLRDAALLLGGTSVCSVAALPLLRGYYQYGSGDALTHLGWTKDLVAGRLDPAGLLYPGVHASTVFTARVLGIRLGRAQSMVVLAFTVAFVVFVALCVRALGRRSWAVPVGVFAGLLLLPVNDVSVHLMTHPITQSLMVFPLVLYLAFRYAVGDESRGGRRWPTPIGTLLSLSLVAVILLHPQGGLNAIAVLLAMLGVQAIARRTDRLGAVRSHRSLAAPTAVGVVSFALWAPRHERVRATATTVFEGVFAASAPGDEIAQRSASLSELGGGIGGLFAKLFLVAAVFSLLTGLLALAWYRGRLGERGGDRSALLAYGFASLVPLFVGFLAFFAASMTTQHFRYVGFLMVPVTILGAVALSEGASLLGPARDAGDGAASLGGLSRRRVGLALCFLLLLPLPIATMHASPFVYQPTQDVTESHLDGAAATFERMDRTVPFAGIRGGPDRYADAVYGTERSRTMGVGASGPNVSVPGRVFGTNLTTHYEGPRYVPVSRSDYRREVGLYDGFRYSERGFQRLRSAPGVDRVYSNGGYRLYLVGDRGGR